MLNAYCTFGSPLKVCLVQGVYTLLQSNTLTQVSYSIRVLVCQRHVKCSLTVGTLNQVVDSN